MQISELLSPDCTKCAVEGASKKRLLETISQIVAPKLSGITRHDIFESLINRERLGSTGIGLGLRYLMDDSLKPAIRLPYY